MSAHHRQCTAWVFLREEKRAADRGADFFAQLRAKSAAGQEAAQGQWHPVLFLPLAPKIESESESLLLVTEPSLVDDDTVICSSTAQSRHDLREDDLLGWRALFAVEAVEETRCCPQARAEDAMAKARPIGQGRRALEQERAGQISIIQNSEGPNQRASCLDSLWRLIDKDME